MTARIRLRVDYPNTHDDKLITLQWVSFPVKHVFRSRLLSQCYYAAATADVPARPDATRLLADTQPFNSFGK